MKNKPIAIDLFCGLGGWTEGFLAEGYQVIGFDIERHVYRTICKACQGTGNFYRNDVDGRFLECDCYEDFDHYGTVESKYPGELVLGNVLNLDGRQFRKHAAVIVASPPCQRYSYMAMPWDRSKREIRWQQWERDSPFGDFRLNDLFDACFRIAAEAELPIIIENVKGAQPWVGRAKWHYGSFYLWGDVPALMPSAKHLKVSGFNVAHGQRIPGNQAGAPQRGDGMKTSGHANIRDGYSHTRHLTNQRESDAAKQGGDWFGDASPGSLRNYSSRSDSRKAASALIAKIPFELSSYIARTFKP